MTNLRSYKSSVLVLLISLLPIGMNTNATSLTSTANYSKNEEALWETYTSKEEEFSVLMPELPGVIVTKTCLDGKRCEKKRIDRTYAAYSEGVVYQVTSYSNPKHRQSLREIIAYSLRLFVPENFDVTDQGRVTLNKFNGERYGIKSKKTIYNSVVTFFLTNDYAFEISAVSEDPNQPVVKKFFESFSLSYKTGKEIGTGARAGSVSSQPAALPKIDPKTSEELPSGIGGGGGEKVFKPAEVTRKAVIVLKPSPEYTEDARRNQVTGTATLQMILSSSGKVISIRTISGLPYGLTEKAIASARHIYFLPALIDGKRVSQYIRVEYNFNIY